MVKSDAWFDVAGVFDDDYLYFYDHLLRDERSDADAELISQLAGIRPDTWVLDVPCGHGRIANRLAARGAEVVGVDASQPFLDLARRDAVARGVDVRYLVGDMRDLESAGVGSGYDVVVNWFTSFGYHDDITDRGVLAGYHQVLRPGGTLLLQTVNRDRLLRSRVAGSPPPAFVVERDDDLMIDRVEVDPPASRAVVTPVLGALRQRGVVTTQPASHTPPCCSHTALARARARRTSSMRPWRSAARAEAAASTSWGFSASLARSRNSLSGRCSLLALSRLSSASKAAVQAKVVPLVRSTCAQPVRARMAVSRQAASRRRSP